MDYNEKLKQFNSTDKYQKELDFLYNLLGDSYQKVLDYGCGNLYAVEKLNQRKKAFFGYDINNEHSDKYADQLGSYDIVYFMHSFAHIISVWNVLKELNTKEVVIITPNKDWLNLQTGDYTPDETVINHYTLKELNQILTDCNYEILVSGQFGKITDNQNERLFIKAKKL